MKRISPVWQIILAATILGSSGVFVKHLGLPPTTLGFFRMGLPVLFLFFYLNGKKHNIWKKFNKTILLASVFNVIHIIFFYIGFLNTSMTNAVIALYTWPIFENIISVIFLKEKVHKRNLILLGTAFLGVFLVFADKEISFANSDFLGMSAMIACALTYAISLAIVKEEAENYEYGELVFYQNSLGLVVFLPFLIFNSPFPNISQLALGTVYGLLIGVVAFDLMFSGIKKLSASLTSDLSYIEVVSSVCFGMIFFGDVITWNVLLGGGMILGSTLAFEED